MERLQVLRAAGAREWSDSLEAVSQILLAADAWPSASGMRRMVARDLVRRGATPTDVLTWATHHARAGRSGAWLASALITDPSAVWKARASGAPEVLAGPLNRAAAADARALVAFIAAARVA